MNSPEKKTEKEILKEFVDDLMAVFAEIKREDRELEFYVKGAEND